MVSPQRVTGEKEFRVLRGSPTWARGKEKKVAYQEAEAAEGVKTCTL